MKLWNEITKGKSVEKTRTQKIRPSEMSHLKSRKRKRMKKLGLVRKREVNEEVQYNRPREKPVEDGLKFPVLQTCRRE